MTSLPRGVRATVRTRRSSALAARLTRPFATKRSTAILIELYPNRVNPGWALWSSARAVKSYS